MAAPAIGEVGVGDFAVGDTSTHTADPAIVGEGAIGSFGIGKEPEYISRNVSSHINSISTNTDTLISLSVTPSSYATAITSASLRTIAVSRNDSSYVSPVHSTTTRSGISFARKPTSHSGPIATGVGTLISVDVNADSHMSTVTTAMEGLESYVVSPTSWSNTITSASDRGSLSYSPRSPSSYVDQLRSFAYNERTSLGLIDYNVTWDDGKAVWYTPWVSEYRVLGSEDAFVIRGSVVDDAKEPAARVVIEYDADGDGTPDEESDLIQLDRRETVEEASGIPVTESGRYRIKITEYSGYNSLYSLDMGIVHK